MVQFLEDELLLEDIPLLHDVVDHILSKINAKDDYDIELQVHDLLLKNVSYVNSNKSSEHTIEGPLLNKKAVCEGIAKATKYLLNMKGIPCELISGTTLKDNHVNHMWNLVFIKGHWYHLDVTWDINLSSTIFRYDYFNLSDEEISSDHFFDSSLHQCLISENGYYYVNNLVMYKQVQFRQFLES